MAENLVEVVFGARVAELLAGVEEAKAAIESLKAPVEAFTGGLTGIAEQIGAAFVVDKVKDFAESVAEAALRIEVVSAALGITTEEASKLSVEIGLLTGNFDVPSRAFEALATNIVAGGTKAKNALKDLAISTQDATRMMTDQDFALRRLSQAFNEGAPGWARTADFVALIGRRFYEQLIPALKQTKEQWDATSKAAEESGAVMTGPQLAAMNAVHSALTSLQAAWLGVWYVMAEQFGKDLVSIIHDLKTLADYLQVAIKWLGWLGDQFNKVAADARDAGRALNNFMSDYLQTSPAFYADIPPKEESKPGTHQLKGPGGDAKAGKKESDDRMQQWRDELRTRLEDEQHFFSDSKQEELDFWRAKAATVQSGSAQDIKLRRELHTEIFNLEKALAKQTEQDRIEEVSYQEKVNNLLIERKKAQLEADLNLGKIKTQQEIAGEKALVDEKMKADEDYYHRKEAAAEGDVRTISKLEQEEYLDHEKLVSEKIALDNKAAEEAHKEWTSIGDTVKQSMDQAVTGVISGTETIGQAFKKLALSILESFGKKIFNTIFDNLWSSLGGAASGGAAGGGGGFLSFLGGLPLIGSLFGGAASGGGGAALGGGLTASLFGGAGGGAAGAAADAALLVLARGGIIPSAAGGWMIPSFQGGGILAKVHSNEMVLPSHISQGFQDMFRSGGGMGGPTINIHAIDTQSGAQFLMRNAGSVADSWRSGGMYGNLSPRSVSSGGRFP